MTAMRFLRPRHGTSDGDLDSANCGSRGLLRLLARSILPKTGHLPKKNLGLTSANCFRTCVRRFNGSAGMTLGRHSSMMLSIWLLGRILRPTSSLKSRHLFTQEHPFRFMSIANGGRQAWTNFVALSTNWKRSGSKSSWFYSVYIPFTGRKRTELGMSAKGGVTNKVLGYSATVPTHRGIAT